jgi:hypothetical protein
VVDFGGVVFGFAASVAGFGGTALAGVFVIGVSFLGVGCGAAAPLETGAVCARVGCADFEFVLTAGAAGFWLTGALAGGATGDLVAVVAVSAGRAGWAAAGAF